MLLSKVKKLFCFSFVGIFFINIAEILRLVMNTAKECHGELRLLKITSANGEGIDWMKLEEKGSIDSAFVYGAQRAQPLHKNSRGKKKLNRENSTTCPFYPYADGGRVAKWDCGLKKSQEILSILPAVHGCRANLDKNILITRFIQKLHNKTLWILGESLSVELFIALSCRLRDRSDLKFHSVTKEELKNVENDKLRNHWQSLHTRDDMRGIHCVKLKDGSWSTRVCLCRVHKAPFEFGHFDTLDKIRHGFLHFKDFASLMQSTDVLLFGFGVSVNSEQVEPGKVSYDRQVLSFFEWYNLRKDALPHLIWRETPAQHFRGSNGFYQSSAPRNECENLPLQETLVTSKSNWRNLVANSVAHKFHVPILKTWSLSAARADAHVGRDCTHYCLPGIPDMWSSLLIETICENLIII